MLKGKWTCYPAFSLVIVFLSACESSSRKIPVLAPPPRARATAEDRAVPLPPSPPAPPRIAATLRWIVDNATDIFIDQGVGVVSGDGSLQVAPEATRTYRLTASRSGGIAHRLVTIEVRVPLPAPSAARSVGHVSSATIMEREVQDAYFDYDSSNLRPDAREVLRRGGEALKRILDGDSSFAVVIEGHCDERGSAEYNLGLGDRRAISAKEFLVGLGVSRESTPDHQLRKRAPSLHRGG